MSGLDVRQGPAGSCNCGAYRFEPHLDWCRTQRPMNTANVDEGLKAPTPTVTYGRGPIMNTLPESKATNPKDAVGTGKVPFSTLPAQPLAEVGLALLEGARKYGRHNYRVAGVRASVYYDAALRHLTAWWEGQDIDPDSGLPHLAKAVAGLVVLRDAQLNDMVTDDRPPPIKDQDVWVARLNEKAKEIIARYPDGLPPYTR